MKSLIAPAVIGLLCMTGGFWYGMKLMPKPAPKPVAAAAAAKAQDTSPTAPHLDAITLDTLKKTSEGMMNLNEALKLREQAVALREQKIHQREDELDAERSTLDASHDRFKTLFKEFQDRLLLVGDNQAQQLQKQSELFTAMGTDQAIDLIRVMDDADMSRLFTVMEVKPLAKTIAAWKTKYPSDAQRLLHVLNAMSQVMPKEKIALTDTPATNAPAADGTPAPAPDATPAPAAGTDGTSSPAPDSAAPAPDGSTLTPPATDSATPSTNDAPPLAPPADSAPPSGKPSSATSTASTF